LRELVIVPPQTRNADTNTPPSWTKLLSEAGFEEKTLTPINPTTTAPTDSDHKRAWLDPKSGRRVEAASYQGQPVWFSVREPAPQRSAPPRAGPPAGFRMMLVFLIVLPIAGILLAWRNIARRRSDYRGALRVAAALLVFILAGVMLRAHHTWSDLIVEWWTLLHLTATFTFMALMCLVLYLAIEPLVRRRWPNMLISWVRLLDGRFRDPMIGRDLLAGAVGGVLVIAAWHGTTLLGIGNLIYLSAVPRNMLGMALGGGKIVIGTMLLGIFEAMLRGIGAVTLLVVLRGLVRNERVTSVLAAVLVAISSVDDASGPLAVRIFYCLLCGVVVVFLLRRFGLLAVVSLAVFVVTLWRIPLTLDSSAWYFFGSAIALLALGSIAIFGFATSTAGKLRMPRLAFEE
jgi:hypothetical protein